MRNSSREFFFALYPYSHLAKGGKDINIDSVLPFVCNPKIVPLSQTKLNSTYLPLRYSWNSLSFDEYVWDALFSIMGKYEGRYACPQFSAKENRLSQFKFDLLILCEAFDASPFWLFPL